MKTYSELSGHLHLITVDRGVTSTSLGISIAGNRDISVMSVYVAAIKQHSPVANDARIRIGDELLEVNTTVTTTTIITTTVTTTTTTVTTTTITTTNITINIIISSLPSHIIIITYHHSIIIISSLPSPYHHIHIIIIISSQPPNPHHYFL